MSNRVEINQPAPDFELKNLEGEVVSLSSFRNKENVLLIFNRGFT
jgi:peroxiredoxin